MCCWVKGALTGWGCGGFRKHAIEGQQVRPPRKAERNEVFILLRGPNKSRISSQYTYSIPAIQNAGTIATNPLYFITEVGSKPEPRHGQFAALPTLAKFGSCRNCFFQVAASQVYKPALATRGRVPGGDPRAVSACLPVHCMLCDTSKRLHVHWKSASFRCYHDDA